MILHPCTAYLLKIDEAWEAGDDYPIRKSAYLDIRPADEELATFPVSSLCVMHRRYVSSDLT